MVKNFIFKTFSSKVYHDAQDQVAIFACHAEDTRENST